MPLTFTVCRVPGGDGQKTPSTPQHPPRQGRSGWMAPLIRSPNLMRCKWKGSVGCPVFGHPRSAEVPSGREWEGRRDAAWHGPRGTPGFVETGPCPRVLVPGEGRFQGARCSRRRQPKSGPRGGASHCRASGRHPHSLSVPPWDPRGPGTLPVPVSVLATRGGVGISPIALLPAGTAPPGRARSWARGRQDPLPRT